MSAVHFVVPDGIDDPLRPSGGNVFDRRICDGLVESGWDVHEDPVAGPWPCVDERALATLNDAITHVPDNNVLVVDGLVASVGAPVLTAAARRLRLVVLVHLPLNTAGEHAVLAAASAVIATSRWARTQLLHRYALTPTAVHVAEPGVDRADAVTGTPGGENLLCVAPVSPHKGHDLLLSALAGIRDLTWHCRFVGSLERNPQFVARIRRGAARNGLADRVEFCGTRTGAELQRAYSTADLLVHASRGETYGMVVAEALSHALPVVATDVGGVQEALGDTPSGRPGLLVSADTASPLAAALRDWLANDTTRVRLRHAAAQRRNTLPSWETTSATIARVLAAVAR